MATPCHTPMTATEGDRRPKQDGRRREANRGGDKPIGPTNQWLVTMGKGKRGLCENKNKNFFFFLNRLNKRDLLRELRMV
jgi:hypothetical protein